MINAALLLLSPGPTWKRLASANRPAWAVFVFTLLPVMAGACAFEAWMLAKHGSYNPAVQGIKHVPEQLAMRYGTTQFIMGVISLFGATLLVRNITLGIAIRTTYSTCFNVVAYSLSVAYLFRILDAWDFLNTWFVCGAAIVSLFATLYTCIPNFIKPDPAKAFGLYVAIVVIVAVCVGASHLFAQLVLGERLFKGGLGLGVLGF